MNEILAEYRRRADGFERLVAGTPPDRWSAPSPCAGWTARDVVAHVIDWGADVLSEQAAIADAPRLADFDEPLEAFRAFRAVVEGVLGDESTKPEVATYLQWSIGFDLPQHGWDLAMATGQDATIDPIDLEILWGPTDPDERARARAAWQWQIDSGWYAPPIEVPDDAPLQDRVIGFLGRDPHWSAP